MFGRRWGSSQSEITKWREGDTHVFLGHRLNARRELVRARVCVSLSEGILFFDSQDRLVQGIELTKLKSWRLTPAQVRRLFWFFSTLHFAFVLISVFSFSYCWDGGGYLFSECLY